MEGISKWVYDNLLSLIGESNICLRMEYVENKSYNSKLVRKKCKFCKCQNYCKPKCRVENKQIKLVKEDALVPKLGSKDQVE